MSFSVVSFFAFDLNADSEPDFASLPFDCLGDFWRIFAEIDAAALCGCEFSRIPCLSFQPMLGLFRAILST